MENWKLSVWCKDFLDEESKKLPPMSKEEIMKGMEFLRKHNYPKPADCKGKDCKEYRPACQLSVCKIAVELCGDF